MTQFISTVLAVATTAWLACACTSAQAQTHLDELLVTAKPNAKRVQSPQSVLSASDLEEQAPTAVAELFRGTPGMQMRVNSRGETVVRVRGGEERQTTVFLDGAPLATPWDGRVDLGMIPAGMIESIAIVKGAAPLEYGANALSGVVDLRSHMASSEPTWRLESQAGSGGAWNTHGLYSTPLNDAWSFTLGMAHMQRDGEPIADEAAIPFDPSMNDLRVNTDQQGNSLFAALSHEGEQSVLRLSWLHVDQERGIAPQSVDDPSNAKTRYWRYPEWQMDQLTASGEYFFDESWSLRGTLWHQWFGQSIHAYDDVTYQRLKARERGDDVTTGARAVLVRETDTHTVRLSASMQQTEHEQQDAQTTAGHAADFIDQPMLTYSQQLTSMGMEMDRRFHDAWTGTIGLGRDHAATPKTGDKPAQPSNASNSVYAALKHETSDVFSWSVSVGKRARFPSPRELFGQSLGRFLINPDLQPERSWLSDVALTWQPSPRLSVDANLWHANNDGTISQRVVRVGDNKLRQRFNLAGSTAYGIETNLHASLNENLRTEVGVARQWGRGKAEPDGRRETLLQRPEHQLKWALDWSPDDVWDMRVELLHGGKAFDLDNDGLVTKLPAHTTVNVRAFARLGAWKHLGSVRLFVTGDNLNNALILPQRGLPAPGRTVRVGIRLDAP